MDVTALVAENVFAFQNFMAGLAGSDIWKIEKSEADELGTAINTVAQHYDIPGVDQKTVDWIRLARTLGMIYGFRLLAIGAFSKKAKPAVEAPKPAPAPAPNGEQERPYVPRKVMASPGPGLPPQEIWQ